MTDSPLISVVIPVYNVEKYIAQCLDSILSQTYHNLEILLTDDGSTDSSGNICDEYIRKDNRIKVFHQQNKGVSTARNNGIRNASGEYISFIDPDDFIDKDFYEYLLNQLYKSDSDIVFCAFRKVNENGIPLTTKENTADTIKTYYKDEAVINCLRARNGFGMYVWNGLFKRNTVPLFNEKILICEDQDFSVAALLKAHQVSICKGVKYNYRIRISGSKGAFDFYSESYKHQLMTLDEMKHHLTEAEASQELFSAYYERCLRMHLCLMDRYSSLGQRDKKLFKQFRNYLIEDAQLTYKWPIGQLLSLIFHAGENAYRFVFWIQKKIFS